MTRTFDYRQLLPDNIFKKAEVFRISHAGWYQKAGETKRWEIFDIACSNDKEGLFWSNPIRFVSEGNSQYELAARLKDKNYEVIHTYPPIIGGGARLPYREFKDLPRLKLGLW